MVIKQIVWDNTLSAADGADILFFCRGVADNHCVEQIQEALTVGVCDAVVPRTYPWATQVCCDPVSLDMNAATLDAFAVSAKAYQAVGGLDIALGEAAATDLVWRLRAAGFAVRYLPQAQVALAQPTKKPYANRLAESLVMRCKHGTLGDVWRGKLLLLKAFAHPDSYQVRRGELLKAVCGVFGKAIARLFLRSNAKAFAEFCGVDYTFSRGEYQCPAVKGTPCVSLIVRTHKRPEVLRKTLESLRHQTYSNFEIVVVEDGEPLSETMIRNEFADLNIRYKATGENVGRAAAANEGFAIAQGTYLNLLDDDDFLLPEHIELAVAAAKQTGADIVFLRGIALETETVSQQPYQFIVRNRRLLDFPHIDVFTMAHQCVTTQNGVFFKRAICKKVGGMRTELGAHEDWSLFLRLMTRGRWTTVPYASCYYIVPANREAERARLETYSAYDAQLLDDNQLQYTLSAAELRAFYDNMIHDFMYLKQRGELHRYLDAEYERLTKGKTHDKTADFGDHTRV